jgi:hypothetical protein
LFCESQNKEAVASEERDPESNTDSPPNLTPGDATLTVITLSETLSCEDVMYCTDCVPKTVKFPRTVKLLAKEAVSAYELDIALEALKLFTAELAV